METTTAVVIDVAPNLTPYFLILDLTLFPAIPTAAAAPTFLTTFPLTVLPPLLLPSIPASSESLRFSLESLPFLIDTSFFPAPLMDGFFWESDHAGKVTDNKTNKNAVSTIWPVNEIGIFIVLFLICFLVTDVIATIQFIKNQSALKKFSVYPAAGQA